MKKFISATLTLLLAMSTSINAYAITENRIDKYVTILTGSTIGLNDNGTINPYATVPNFIIENSYNDIYTSDHMFMFTVTLENATFDQDLTRYFTANDNPLTYAKEIKVLDGGGNVMSNFTYNILRDNATRITVYIIDKNGTPINLPTDAEIVVPLIGVKPSGTSIASAYVSSSNVGISTGQENMTQYPTYDSSTDTYYEDAYKYGFNASVGNVSKLSNTSLLIKELSLKEANVDSFRVQKNSTGYFRIDLTNGYSFDKSKMNSNSLSEDLSFNGYAINSNEIVTTDSVTPLLYTNKINSYTIPTYSIVVEVDPEKFDYSVDSSTNINLHDVILENLYITPPKDIINDFDFGIKISDYTNYGIGVTTEIQLNNITLSPEEDLEIEDAIEDDTEIETEDDIEITVDNFTDTIYITIGDEYITVGGNEIETGAPAYINENNYTMLPLRAVSDALLKDADIAWDQITETVTIKSGNDEIVMMVGGNVMTINGVNKIMSTSPEISGDRTFVPLRDLLYAFDLSDDDFAWDSLSRTIKIL